MKTIQVGEGIGIDKLQIINKEVPLPQSGEVLIKWHATSLNYHDYLVAKGDILVQENRIPMSDGAGEIVETGSNVTEWKVGDKVMSMFFPNWQDGPPELHKIAGVSGESIDGYITEYSCVPSHWVTRIPQDYSFSEAATLPCAALTAWNGLVNSGDFKGGDSVLIEGTGGMSIFGLQIAKAYGCRVFATTSDNAKAEKLLSMGCEAVVNYKEDELWGKTIYKKSKGGVDHILDVGGGSTIQQSIEASKIGGHITSIGILSGGRKGTITFPKLFFKFTHIRGIAVGNKTMQNDLVRFLDKSDFRPMIDKSFAFDELAEAFRYQETGQHFGKIVVEW